MLIWKTISLVLIVFNMITIESRFKSRVHHCHENEGTSVFIIKVHIDRRALYDIQKFVSTLYMENETAISAASRYFGGIFDEINLKLYDFGVQFKGDFTELDMDKLYMPYDKAYCSEESPAFDRGTIAMNVLEVLSGGDLGNRLLVFYCPMREILTDTHVFKFSDCGSLTAITYTLPEMIDHDIKSKLVSAVFRARFDFYGFLNDEFNKKVCYAAENCVGFIPNANGFYLDGQKEVKNVGRTDEEILENLDNIGEKTIDDYEDSIENTLDALMKGIVPRKSLMEPRNPIDKILNDLTSRAPKYEPVKSITAEEKKNLTSPLSRKTVNDIEQRYQDDPLKKLKKMRKTPPKLITEDPKTYEKVERKPSSPLKKKSAKDMSTSPALNSPQDEEKSLRSKRDNENKKSKRNFMKDEIPLNNDLNKQSNKNNLEPGENSLNSLLDPTKNIFDPKKQQPKDKLENIDGSLKMKKILTCNPELKDIIENKINRKKQSSRTPEKDFTKEMPVKKSPTEESKTMKILETILNRGTGPINKPIQIIQKDILSNTENFDDDLLKYNKQNPLAELVQDKIPTFNENNENKKVEPVVRSTHKPMVDFLKNVLPQQSKLDAPYSIIPVLEPTSNKDFLKDPLAPELLNPNDINSLEKPTLNDYIKKKFLNPDLVSSDDLDSPIRKNITDYIPEKNIVNVSKDPYLSENIPNNYLPERIVKHDFIDPNHTNNFDLRDWRHPKNINIEDNYYPKIYEIEPEIHHDVHVEIEEYDDDHFTRHKRHPIVVDGLTEKRDEKSKSRTLDKNEIDHISKKKIERKEKIKNAKVNNMIEDVHSQKNNLDKQIRDLKFMATQEKDPEKIKERISNIESANKEMVKSMSDINYELSKHTSTSDLKNDISDVISTNDTDATKQKNINKLFERRKNMDNMDSGLRDLKAKSENINKKINNLENSNAINGNMMAKDIDKLKKKYDETGENIQNLVDLSNPGNPNDIKKELRDVSGKSDHLKSLIEEIYKSMNEKNGNSLVNGINDIQKSNEKLKNNIDNVSNNLLNGMDVNTGDDSQKNFEQLKKDAIDGGLGKNGVDSGVSKKIDDSLAKNPTLNEFKSEIKDEVSKEKNDAGESNPAKKLSEALKAIDEQSKSGTSTGSGGESAAEKMSDAILDGMKNNANSSPAENISKSLDDLFAKGESGLPGVKNEEGNSQKSDDNLSGGNSDKKKGDDMKKKPEEKMADILKDIDAKNNPDKNDESSGNPSSEKSQDKSGAENPNGKENDKDNKGSGGDNKKADSGENKDSGTGDKKENPGGNNNDDLAEKLKKFLTKAQNDIDAFKSKI